MPKRKEKVNNAWKDILKNVNKNKNEDKYKEVRRPLDTFKEAFGNRMELIKSSINNFFDIEPNKMNKDNK